MPCGSSPAGGASATIAAYHPCSVSEAAASFARQVVLAGGPGSPARAKAYLFAASRLAAFGESVGLHLDERLLCEPVIERFIITGTAGLSAASVRTLRTNLRALERALARHPEPPPVGLPRERAKAPYSNAEIEGYLRLAACQSTKARRMRAAALICLGAGAGIVAGELRNIRGSDVCERHDGVLVALPGKRSRIVPVLARFHEPLLQAAAFAGQRLLIGGRDPGRQNITCSLIAALSADPALGRLESGRLRSTWLAEAAQLIGLGAFMAAAGVVCSQRLGDIACALPPASEAQMVALLGGSS